MIQRPFRERLRRNRIGWELALWIGGGTILVFLALPLIGLVFATLGRGWLEGLRNEAVWPALRLSATTTAISLFFVPVPVTALAWLLSRNPGRLARWIESLVQLPVVIPPAVAGVAMLGVFGRRGVGGGLVAEWGIEIPFTLTAGGFAEIFVSAPFYLQAAIASFRRIDPNLLVVSRTLGASPGGTFLRVALPIALPGLISGAAMSWARSLGEFGATLMFAGNLAGRTQTLPLAIYAVLETDLRAAQSLSLMMVVIAFVLLLVLRTFTPIPRTPLPGTPPRT